jgi:hypothetical protein
LANFGQPNSATSLVVSGGFALWNSGNTLTRRDFATSQNATISTGAGNDRNDVAPNGDVAYWTTSYQIVRVRGGVSAQLTNDTLWSTYPLTDGVNVVYRKTTPCCAGNQQFQIAVYDTVEHTLTSPDQAQRSQGTDYQVTNGWVAFTRTGTAGELQIWTRSPAGQELQVTRFGTSSRIEALGPGGDVVLDNAFGGVTRRYLAVPNYSTQPRDIGSALVGSPLFLSGGLFIAIGRSLFRVNP